MQPMTWNNKMFIYCHSLDFGILILIVLYDGTCFMHLLHLVGSVSPYVATNEFLPHYGMLT